MADNVPTVSVIIPTCNRAHLVGRAIRSVLNQTYQDFEIIVVDDGSTDNTEEVVKSFNDPRIRYIRHEQNKGAAAARNTGIKASKGKFIAFQDSDDEWLPEKLEKQMKVFENAPLKIGVVYTDMWRIDGNNKEYWHSPRIMPEEGTLYEQALDRVMGIGIQTAVIRRECFDKIGLFDEQFPRFIDLEFFIRLSKYYYFYHINEPLVNHYRTKGSISSDNRALIRAYELLFAKHSYDIVKDRKSLARHFFVIGNALCLTGEITKGKTYLFKASISHPLNPKYLAAALLSLFGEKAYNKVVKLKRRIGLVKARGGNDEA